MLGGQLAWLPDGDHTLKAGGAGLMMDGIGLRKNHGHGQRTTTGVGTMMISTDGCGFLDMTGRPRGLNGGMVVTALGGHR
jgi:hypothetical protein